MTDPETTKELISAAKDYVDKVVDAPLSQIGSWTFRRHCGLLEIQEQNKHHFKSQKVFGR